MRGLIGLMCALALSVAFVGCGSEGPGCAEPAADVAGEWQMTSTVVSDDCDGRMSQVFPMTITQDGNAVTAEVPELTFSGTICGSQIQMKGSFPEDDGTVTVNATLTVAADGNSMEGMDNWTWSDGSESCSGSDSLRATRIATGGCEGAADGTPCSGGGACLDGVCTELTSVSGTVTLFDANDVESPAAGVTVSVIGTSLSTTTNDRGEFSFGVFEGDWFFQSAKDDLGGLIQLETVTTASDLELFVYTEAFGAELEQALGIEIDRTKGVISVNFSIAPGMAVGGETAELSEPYEHTSATNASGDEVLTNALLPQGGPDLTFWNVNTTEELVVTPKWIDGMGECVLEEPEIVYPIRAGFATLGADARCTRFAGSSGP